MYGLSGGASWPVCLDRPRAVARPLLWLTRFSEPEKLPAINLAVKQVVLIYLTVALEILAQLREIAGLSRARDRASPGGGTSMCRINPGMFIAGLIYDQTAATDIIHMHDTLQALLDRQAIQDTLVRYAHALDSFNNDLLDQVFTADADLDYSAAGGIRGNRAELRAWLEQAMSRFDSWQHLLSNFVICQDGDRASAVTRCYNPLQGRRADGSTYVYHAGACYYDELTRTAEGWRIHKRRLGMDWADASQAPEA